MQVHITARHIELTSPLADYVEKRLERVGRHFNAAIRAHIILDVQKQRHIAEVISHAAGMPDFRAKGESADLYAAVDLVVEKLHKHMARLKDKRVRGRRAATSLRLVPAPEDLPDLSGEAPDGAEPRVTRVSRFIPHMMTVAEAVEELEVKKHGFTVFMNDDQLAVLYKRQDGTYGLLEPERALKLVDILAPESVLLDLKAQGKREALEEMCRFLAGAKKLSDPDALVKTLLDREALGSTGIGQGVAIPHGKSPAVPGQAAALALSKKGVAFDSLDGEPVHILFLLVAPPEAAGMHLKALAHDSRLLKDKFFRQALRDAPSADEILRIIREEDDY